MEIVSGREGEYNLREASGQEKMPAPMTASKALTPRKALVYLGVGALVVLAEPWWPTFVAGATLAFLGIALRVWGCGHLEKNVVLVTTGPYAHVKNPLYLGSFLIAVGGFLAAGAPSGRGLWVWIALAPVFALAFFFAYLPRKKSVEGERLARKFGEAFERYDAAVPDFVPRLTPFRSGDDRRWAWGRFWENHELGMDVLIFGLFALIWVLPRLAWLPV